MLACGAQVSNGEVYYKAVSFYLEEHPDLLVDLLKVPALAALAPVRDMCGMHCPYLG